MRRPLLRCLVWASLRNASAREVDSGCGAGSPYPPGLHEFLRVEPRGSPRGTRRFSVYVPRDAPAGKALPLLLLAPGNRNDPHEFLKFPDLLSFAEGVPFILAELIGAHDQFNVELHSLDSPDRPDDVAYVGSVLRHVGRRLCVDRRRVFCAGMSRGARFCARLASELSDVIAALGIVSGLRYPQPNNATRPVPLIAFHGTADAIDPYEGGGPEYWGPATVPQELARWGAFNGCKDKEAVRLPDVAGVRRETLSGCRDGADVTLYTIEGAQHSSPGTSRLYGPKTDLLNVTGLMWSFLSEHAMSRDPPHGWDQLFALEPAGAPPQAGGRRLGPALLCAAAGLPPLLVSGLLACRWSRRACSAASCRSAAAGTAHELGPLL